jgi:hypothetical protein
VVSTLYCLEKWRAKQRVFTPGDYLKSENNLQTVSSEEAAENNSPDWVNFKTSADEVSQLICSPFYKIVKDSEIF